MGAPRRKAITILTTLALVITTYACGGDDDDDADEGTRESPATTVPVTTAPVTAAPDTTVPPTTAPTTDDPGTTAPSATGSTGDPCEPLGTLVPGTATVPLNDRCDWALDLGTDLVGAEDDDGNLLVWADSACENMLAVREQLLFTMAAFDEGFNPIPPPNMADASQALVDDIGELGLAADIGPTLTDRSGLVTVSAPLEAVRAVIPQLQREDRSVDLNYFEAALPNNVFRPVGDPEPSSVPIETFAGGGGIVAVIDSAGPGGQYDEDIDGNGLVDEDNGHGTFVASIVGRSGAQPSLIGIPENGAQPTEGLLASGRWAPMLFSDAELINALGKVGLETSIVNLSLGGVGCPSRSPGVAIGERLALAQAIDNIVMERLVNGPETGLAPIEFVAAAGNIGPDVAHFPAAWRRADVLIGLANDPTVDPAAIPRIENMQARLAEAITAVGSIDASGQRSMFSNCGTWVNAAAYGEDQVGAYQWSTTGFATWSGTSFAAANFTATLAVPPNPAGVGAVGTDLNSRHPTTGAYMTGAQGLPCQ